MNTLLSPLTITSQPVEMSKREYNKLLSKELYFDIIAFMSILYKTGFDECVEKEVLFVEMLNEAGFKTVQGKEFSLMSYRLFMNRMDEEVKTSVKDLLKGY